ncbi:hypothetical protein VPNG_00519 [Cytospora leucostoma]|uniref:Uncharacterized protein n=1 Tax=Cytospora leucostoma TaxID=1230097 RepID=A0A423XME1_9PEZI|nr:hypothetical protein VPNG_00519 [Cytospora leucostoma]
MAPNDVDQVGLGEVVAAIEVEIEDTQGGTSQSHVIRLYADTIFKIGRDPDNNLTYGSDFIIDDLAVSRNHIEFYSVIFDDTGHHPAMVYVRDRQSNNGTLVNDEPISKGGGSITPARLLQNGDTITIPPNVTFRFIQPMTPKETLSSIQSEEVKIFGDRFTITDRTVGSGASARVHLAIDRKTGEQIACKVYDLYSTEKAGQKDSIQRLMQETSVRCQMEHPNIAAFRGAYKSRSTLYVFEDLATGGDLFSLMVRVRQFTESDVRWMVRQVVHAVAYMHEKGVVHRDLKLENILCAICPRPGHRLVVTDFGHLGLVGHDRMDSIVGTAGWQAPPRGNHGPPVDIWSIGVLATQLLAGDSKVKALEASDTPRQPACEMKEPAHQLKMIFKELSEIRSEDICEDAKDFIRRCFHHNPQKRMTAAEAVTHPWLCKPDEDLKLFLQREEETTADWNRREVLEKVVKQLPNLRQPNAHGSPYFTSKENGQGLHATRRTEERKESMDDKKPKRKRSRVRDISMVPQYQGLERRLRPRNKVSSRDVQKQVLKTLAESGKMFIPRYARDQDGVGGARANKRVRTEDQERDSDERACKRSKG